jgi:hypothetical protein
MHASHLFVAGLAALSVAGPACAAPFSIFENADAVSTTHLAIDVQAYQAADAIDFVVTNSSSGPGGLTSLVIENTPTSSRLGPLSIIGASWSIDTNASPPGSVSNHGA